MSHTTSKGDGMKKIKAWAIIESVGYNGRKGRGIRTGGGPSIYWRKYNAECSSQNKNTNSVREVVEVEIRILKPQTKRGKVRKK